MKISKCIYNKCQYHGGLCNRYSQDGVKVNMKSVCHDNNYFLFEIDWNFYKTKHAENSAKQKSENSTEEGVE